MTFEQVIRAAMPDASEAVVDYVLWGRTPFPMGKVSARDLYQAAARFRRACISGHQLCELCDRVAADGWICARCNAALAKHE